MAFYIEFVGYIASILVLISLMMSSLLKLRLISLAGAFFFVIYGILIGSYPITLVNIAIIIVNLYYLYRMFTNKEYFTLMETSSHSTYLQYFLDFYRDDIRKIQPNYRFMPNDDQMIIFILRNMVPAGLLIGKRDPKGAFRIYLDYVSPTYRDSKIANHLFFHSQYFQQHDIHKLMGIPSSEAHKKYLQHMGFQRELNDDGQPVYCLALKENYIQENNL